MALMAALADEGREEYHSLAKVAKNHKLPYKFLGAIAGKLKQAGMIESREGVAGGYRLSKAPEKISLGQVVKILDNGVGLSDCTRGIKCLRHRQCLHKGMVTDLNREWLSMLQKRSVADLLVRE